MIIKNKNFLKASLYYQFCYYQDLVEQFGIRFNQKDNNFKNKSNFTISHPFYITFLRCYYNIFVLRGAAILFLSAATSTRERRVWLFIEHWRANATNCEGTLFLWSALLAVFFKVTLSDNLLDYKWLAVFRMTDKVEPNTDAFLHPNDAGLTSSDFRKFSRFRKALVLYYHSIFTSLVPFSWLAMVFTHIQADIFSSHPIWAYFSCFMINFWIYVCCASHYTLLLSFSLTARYIQIKQDTFWKKAAHSYGRLVDVASNALPVNSKIPSNISVSRAYLTLDALRTFHKGHAAYVTLFAELADYNRFWGSYLSTVFLVYSTIVAFALYIVIYGQVIWYLNVAYAFIFVNHALSISVIISICGMVAFQQQKWAFRCSSFSGRLVKGATRVGGALTTGQVVKLHINVNEGVAQLNKAGFVLSNGRQITHQTFQVIISNIGFFFFLTLQNILYGN